VDQLPEHLTSLLPFGSSGYWQAWVVGSGHSPTMERGTLQFR